MFVCSKCGCCCRNLDKSEIYKNLDRGDGVCKYLNGNICAIYEDRPILCRIDECYSLYYSDIYTKEEYYRLNHEACQRLQNKT